MHSIEWVHKVHSTYLEFVVPENVKNLIVDYERNDIYTVIIIQVCVIYSIV